jgi:hypothetical protein
MSGWASISSAGSDTSRPLVSCWAAGAGAPVVVSPMDEGLGASCGSVGGWVGTG